MKSSSYILYNLNYNFGLKKIFNCSSILNSRNLLLVFNPFKSFVDGLHKKIEKDLSLVAIPCLNPIEFEEFI